MRVVPAELYQMPPRRGFWFFLTRSLAVLCLVLLGAAAGTTWNRTSGLRISYDDARRVFVSPRDAAEKEQALGALSRHQREITALQIECENDESDPKTANDSRLYLDQLVAMLAKRRRK
jgi:hypothetical protein